MAHVGTQLFQNLFPDALATQMPTTYETNATEDDGSCVYDSDGDGIIDSFEVLGCTGYQCQQLQLFINHDDGSCDYDEDDDGVYDWAEEEGCTDIIATNYDYSSTEKQPACANTHLL